MRILLDTQVLIWWDEGGTLSDSAARAIEEADLAYVSAASAWEIAIKAAKGELRPRRPTWEAVAGNGLEELLVRFEHVEIVKELPLHHRDPFDRLLIAQAIAEKLTIVTRDRMFERYDVKTIAA